MKWSDALKKTIRTRQGRFAIVSLPLIAIVAMLLPKLIVHQNLVMILQLGLMLLCSIAVKKFSQIYSSIVESARQKKK